MPRILRQTDYRPLERLNHVRIVHHKTAEVVWHPLEAAEATRKPHNLRAAIIELDKQGTTSLFWSQRRAEKHRPDDLIGKIDENPVQPEVHRVDPSTLLATLEEMCRAGLQFVVLDLPGGHNPAVMMAMSMADYVLIPSRPHDVDLHKSLETAAAAKRLDKPMAYVLTFVPPTGCDAERVREDLEQEKFTVAPGGLGDRRKECAAAISDGTTVREKDSHSKSAKECATASTRCVSMSMVEASVCAKYACCFALATLEGNFHLEST